MLIDRLALLTQSESFIELLLINGRLNLILKATDISSPTYEEINSDQARRNTITTVGSINFILPPSISFSGFQST